MRGRSEYSSYLNRAKEVIAFARNNGLHGLPYSKEHTMLEIIEVAKMIQLDDIHQEKIRKTNEIIKILKDKKEEK